jgi:hypothetical protein
MRRSGLASTRGLLYEALKFKFNVRLELLLLEKTEPNEKFEIEIAVGVMKRG